MSAFNLGSVRGLLGLDESNFVRGMLNAETANEVFGRSVVEFVNNPLLGTIRVFKEFTGAAIETVKETAAINQELFRMSERTGVSARTLSGLKAEFEDLHIAGEALEKVFVVLNRRMIESANNQQVAQLFAQLGLSARDANGQLKDTDTFLREASDALVKLESPTQRMTALQQLFGEESFKAYTILANGSRVIEDTIRNYDELGRVIDDEVASSSNAAAAALGNVDHAFQGIKATLAGEFLRGVGGDVDSVTDASKELVAVVRDDLGPLARALGEKTPPALEAIANWIAEINDGIKALREIGELPVLKQIVEVSDKLSVFSPFSDNWWLSQLIGFGGTQVGRIQSANEITALGDFRSEIASRRLASGWEATTAQGQQYLNYLRSPQLLHDAMVAARMAY